MKQVEKYLLKVALLLGIFIMPFAASAEEIDMKEKVAKFLNDTGFAQLFAGDWLCLVMILHTILFSYCKEIRTFVIITHRLWYVIDELTRSRVISSGTFRRRTCTLGKFLDFQ